MSGKSTFTVQLNWVATNPAPYRAQNPWSGVTTGTMTGTNTIYTNIIDLTTKDNEGLEITWTGTPTGVISVLGSASGTTFYPLTFSPSLTQPAGAAGGYLVSINQFPWRYLIIQYVNTSGTGTLSVYATAKDLN